MHNWWRKEGEEEGEEQGEEEEKQEEQPDAGLFAMLPRFGFGEARAGTQRARAGTNESEGDDAGSSYSDPDIKHSSRARRSERSEAQHHHRSRSQHRPMREEEDLEGDGKEEEEENEEEEEQMSLVERVVGCWAIVHAAGLIALVLMVAYTSMPISLNRAAARGGFAGGRAHDMLSDMLELNDNKPHVWGSPEMARVVNWASNYGDELAAQFPDRVQVELESWTATSANPYAAQQPAANPTNDTEVNCTCNQCGGSPERPCVTYALNILIKGTNRTGDGKAVMLSAHLDSTRHGPGAADDGSGSVTLLELARVFAETPADSDVLIVLFDAEEAGLIGSGLWRERSKFRDMPSALITVEAGGAGDKEYLLRCDSLELVQAYVRYAPRQTAYSFIGWMDATLQMGWTDSAQVAKLGVKTMDLVFLDNRWAYHTSEDTLENVSPASLQRVGDNVLAIVRGLTENDAVPERFAEGETPLAGAAAAHDTYKVFQQINPDNYGAVFFSMYEGQTWLFTSVPTAQGVLAATAVLLVLFTAALAAGLERGENKAGVLFKHALFDLVPVVMWWAVSAGFAILAYNTMANAMRSPDAFHEAWRPIAHQQTRLAFCFVSFALAQVALVRFTGDCCCISHVREEMEARAGAPAAPHDKPSTLAAWTSSRALRAREGVPWRDLSTELAVRRSLEMHLAVQIALSVLLFAAAIANVHVAMIMFWPPIFLAGGLLAHAILRAVVGDNISPRLMLAMRTFLVMFFTGIMVLNFALRAIVTFAGYLDQMEIGMWAIPSVVSIIAAGVLLPVLPELITMDRLVLDVLLGALLCVFVGLIVAVATF